MTTFEKLVELTKAEKAMQWWWKFTTTEKMETRDKYLAYKFMGKLNPFDIKCMHDQFIRENKT